MSRKFNSISLLSYFALMAVSAALGQTGQHLTMVTTSVNDAERVTLYGNIHPAMRNATDLGQVPDDKSFEHLLLQMKRPEAEQRALDQYIEDLHNPNSPSYHKWGAPTEFSQRFGLAPQDLDAVKSWLRSKGFKINTVYPNLVVDFSGTAGQVREAFHTAIHKVMVNGEQHISNMSNPEIPAALGPVVVGPVTLNDFKPRRMARPRAQYTVDTTFQLVVPADLQTIYNFNPLYRAGISGQGQTVVLLERTNLYSNGDWNTFRKTLGLSRQFPMGKLVVVHPQPGSGGTCSDPGVLVGDDGEAAVDVEWASAAAPNATIELASCADTELNFGAFIALQNLLTGSGKLPSIASLSYSSPESEQGADYNAYINSLYELAVFEGMSLYVSTGDAGAAITDVNQKTATHGINVNALASTPHNVAVGGTDFGDAFLGENSTYWSDTNAANYGSAKSYIPEIPWNDSCASQLISIALGYATPFGADGACNSDIGEQNFLTTAAGSGGPSACAYGAPDVFGVVGGTCSGYAKPSYQRRVFGNPNDHVRDLPDVSMFAANGVWGHYFVICYSNPAGGGVPCNNPPVNWAGAGGTSFGAPILAGVQALINQATDAAQGNPNYPYYSLAATEYGHSGNSGCNSTLGNATDPACIFYDITLGDMDVNCKPLTSHGVTVGTFNCYYPSTNPGPNGVLSTSNTSYKPAYGTHVGWDFATGVGTINVYNLVASWPGSSLALSAKRKQ
jgi:subtilase family serine protease